MQFKNPEILFLLFLLLIPLLIHLFQLQRFRKQTFTNVKFLKEIELETRKSSRLKKLLILASRMLLMTALIFAFSQPFFNNNPDLRERKSIFYIDNSLSMLAKSSSDIDLLQLSKHNILDKIDDIDAEIMLITNQKLLSDLDKDRLNKELLELGPHPIKKDINQVLLQINDLVNSSANTLYDIFLISDFQDHRSRVDSSLINTSFDYSLIDVSIKKLPNISLDSVWISKETSEQTTLIASVSSVHKDQKNLSISLIINNELFAKTTVDVTAGTSESVEFLIPNLERNQGKITLSDRSLIFDNELYFNIAKRPRKKVLVIGVKSDFLGRIYQPQEFELSQINYTELDQGKIADQDLLVLNELEQLSNPLIQTLQSFLQNNGNIVVIPSKNANIDSYNNLLSSIKAGVLIEPFKDPKSITTIHYAHPFFDEVFEKKVYNFDYPDVAGGFRSSLINATSLLELEDVSPFLSEIKYGNHKVYWFSSSLTEQAIELTKSPLIVPVFLKFLSQGKNDKAIYLTIGKKNEFYMNSNYKTEQPLKITKDNMEFIPQQIRTSNRIKIITEDHPIQPGLYELREEGNIIEHLAYNYDRSENKLNHIDQQALIDAYDNVHVYTSIDKALSEGNKRNNNKELWQLFIIFAVVFLILEILFQKFLKN